MTTEELIEIVNNNKIPSLHCLCVYVDMDQITLLAEGLYLDEHRWFSTAVNVYECIDGIVGIRGTYQSFSEQADWSDFGFECLAREYEAVPSVTYKPRR